jgi:Tfp pilus assembly protein PilW
MMKKQRGVTLIEIMISMMLGLGLIAGIGQLFVQSQKSFTLQRNLSDMTDDAVFALEDLRAGLLSAGNSETGTNFECYKKDSCFTQIPPSLKLIVAETQTDVLGSGLDLNCFETTDKKVCETIKGTDDKLVYRFKLDATQSHKNNSICIVTSSKPAGYDPQDIVPVYVFYKGSDKSMSCTSKSNAQPMISEVEKLEFRYGIKDKDAGLFYYTKAENVTDWTTVFAVKVFLVMRSADNNLVRTQKGYEIDGVDADPAPTDKRLYKTFSKTIFLRANDH